MNNEIKNALSKVKEDLFNEKIVQEYIKLKEIIENSEELSNLHKKISYLQKCQPTEDEKEEYFKLLKQYNENPLIVQFKSISDEVYDLLEEIKKEIEL